MPGNIVAPTNRFAPRAVRFVGRLAARGWRLKVYSIRAGGGLAEDALVTAAKAWAADHLAALPGRARDHGVGCLGVHQGDGTDMVFLGLWSNENEMRHIVAVRKPGESSLTDMRVGHPDVCVWDLHVLHEERTRWIRHVIGNPAGPDLDAYLADVFEGDV